MLKLRTERAGTEKDAAINKKDRRCPETLNLIHACTDQQESNMQLPLTLCKAGRRRQTLTMNPLGSAGVMGLECSSTLPPVRSPCITSTLCRYARAFASSRAVSSSFFRSVTPVK